MSTYKDNEVRELLVMRALQSDHMWEFMAQTAWVKSQKPFMQILVGINPLYWGSESKDFPMKLICDPKRAKNKSLSDPRSLSQVMQSGNSHYVSQYMRSLWIARSCFAFAATSEACADSRRWMCSVLSVRISLLPFEKWLLLSSGKAEICRIWVFLELNLMWSQTYFLKFHPVLLECIMVSVVPGTRSETSFFWQEDVGDLLWSTINSFIWWWMRSLMPYISLKSLLGSGKQASHVWQHLWQEAR